MRAWRPSGDSASDTGSVVGGVTISTRRSAGVGAGFDRVTSNAAATAAARTTTVIHNSRSRQRTPPATRTTPASPRCASSMSSAASRMSASRRRRSFSRQRRNSRRRLSGVDAGRRDQSGRRSQDRRNGLRRIAPFECPGSRQHLEQHGAERPDVGRAVGALTAGLFRTHVCRCAEDHAERRHGGAGHGCQESRPRRWPRVPVRAPGRSPAPSPCRRAAP